jgi:alpha-L-rhamnosidase
MKFSKLVFFTLFISALSPYAYSKSTVYGLTVDYQTNPLGIDNSKPLLSWKIRDERTSIKQTAYQIIISSTDKKLKQGIGDIWNTGKVSSDQSVHIRYNGSPLTSRQRCFWKVKVWNNKGEESDFGEVGFWEMGLLQPSDWTGKWISQVPDHDSVPPLLPAPMFRKVLSLSEQKIKKARAYISGLGYYELFVNGEKVSDHVLDPVLTRYDKRVKYVTHDITDLLDKGENVIGVTLGTGWYNYHTRSAWDFDKALWRNSPTLLCQVEVELGNGKKVSLSSDQTWKVTNGPLQFDGIMNGEFYDARKEVPGWSNKGFNNANWKNSVVVMGPSGFLSAQSMPPIRVIKTIKPRKITILPNEVYGVDFGQNMAGRIRLKVKGKAGDHIIIRYGEKLKSDGTLDQKELARFIFTGETQTDHYVANGKESESWAPSFTYYGFQYVEIEGYPGMLTEENIEAEVLHTDLKDAGSFSCSNDLFNKLHEATRWAFLSNYHSYPTDCPHREKIGWTGDAQLAAETGLYNFQMAPSYLKWIDDFCDEQQSTGQVSGIIPTSGWGYTLGRDTTAGRYKRGYGPQWEGAFATIPWYMFQYYGDTSVVERYYQPIKKYLIYLKNYSRDHLLDFGIDDHKPLKVVTDGPILASGFYYSITNILAKMAAVINESADEKYFRLLGDSIKHSFNKKYYNPTDHLYGNGGETSLGEALYFNLNTEKIK